MYLRSHLCHSRRFFLKTEILHLLFAFKIEYSAGPTIVHNSFNIPKDCVMRVSRLHELMNFYLYFVS